MNTLPSKIKVSSSVLFQEISNEFVLLNMETEKYFGLDEVGARFWELLKEEEDVDKVIAALLNEYNVDEPTLRSDIAALVESLKTAKLVLY
ncbi:MAG: PqqD family protein [Flavobacteriales bacterium]